MSTETQDLKAGPQLDARVAERIIGLVPCTHEFHRTESGPAHCYARPESPDQGACAREYSTDVAEALPVWFAPRLLDAGWAPFLNSHPTVGGGWRHTVGLGHDDYDAEVEDVGEPSEIPAAICRVALRAVEAMEANAG